MRTQGQGDGNLAEQRTRPATGADAAYLPDLEAWRSKEQASLLADTSFDRGDLGARSGGHQTPAGRLSYFTSAAMAGDAQAAIRSQTTVVIERRQPAATIRSTTGARLASRRVIAPRMVSTNLTDDPIEVGYDRTIAYADARGRQIQIAIASRLWFAASQWQGSEITTRSSSFAELLTKRASKGEFVVKIVATDRLGTIETSLTGVEPTLGDQSRQASGLLADTLQRGNTTAAADASRFTGFLMPQATVGHQYRAIRAFLDEALRRREEERRRQLDPVFRADLRKVKDILLEEWVGEDQERTLLRIMEKWAEQKDVLTSAGRSYFDALLLALRNSSWHRDYLIAKGSSTTFYSTLFDKIDQHRGALLTLISRNSIEFGHYLPSWRPRKGPSEGNEELVKRAADQVLDALGGYTSSVDKKVIVDTLVGLGSAQRPVLEEIMSRHDERTWIGLGRYGEPTKTGMLYWLFEDLDRDRREELAKSLVANGTLTADAVESLKAGRGMGGKYLPWTTHFGREATEYWADKAVKEDSTAAKVMGGFSSLWLPETAFTTVGVLAGARIAPQIARIHPYVEAGMVGTGTFFSAYGVGIHGQAVLAGRDPYSGQKLSEEEMIANRLMLLSSGLFLGAGFMQAPAVQRRVFQHRAPRFGELPPGFEASKLEVRPFSRPGQKLTEPFAAEGRQLIRHPSGEVVEVRGPAAAKEFTVTRLSTGERIFISRGGEIRLPGTPLPATASPPAAAGAGGPPGLGVRPGGVVPQGAGVQPGARPGTLMPTTPLAPAAVAGPGQARSPAAAPVTPPAPPPIGGVLGPVLGTPRAPPAAPTARPEVLLPKELRPEWSAGKLSPEERASLKRERRELGRQRWKPYVDAKLRTKMIERLRASKLLDEFDLDDVAIADRVLDHMIDLLQAGRPTYVAEGLRGGQMAPTGRRPTVETMRKLLKDGGALEGFVLDAVLAENVTAFRNLLSRIDAIEPDAILAVQKGGVFLADVLEYGSPSLASRLHRVPKGSENQRTPHLKERIADLILAGQRTFVVVDVYMGGGAAGEFRNMYDELLTLPQAKGVTFETLWLRETLGFERLTTGGLGTAPAPPATAAVRDTTEVVRIALGDDMKMIFNPRSKKPIVIFGWNGALEHEISVPVKDPVTGETLTTPRQVLVRLMNGIEFWD